MGGGPVSNNTASPGARLVALLVVVAFAVLGGFIVKVLSKG
jgi:hypothetical protein